MKEQKRKLPIVDIGGAEFFADAYKGWFIDTLNPENTIHPLSIIMLEDHLELLFDRHTRNIKASNWREWDDDRYKHILLHHVEFYDPEGMELAMKESGKNINRDLPVVEIEGVKFLWDNSLTALRQQDNLWNMIRMNDYSWDGDVHGFYFDVIRKVVPFRHEIPILKPGIRLPIHLKFIPYVRINEGINTAIKTKEEQDRKANHKGIKFKNR
jgi:hypothetical protein